MKNKLLSCFLWVIMSTAGIGKADAQQNAAVYISDIDHFWEAFDSVHTTADTALQVAIMQKLYIDKGTAGLKAFMQLRNFDAARLVASIHKYPKFWASARPNTLKVPPALPLIQAYLDTLKAMYPAMRPAPLYFTITAVRAAGVAETGIALIGTEIATGNRYTDVSEFPDKRLANFFQPKETDNIIPVAIHEYVHTQQKGEGKVLLSQSIYEGACDFITELVLHEPLMHSYLTYGRLHEQELKEAFKKEMFGEELSNWLYNGSTSATMGDLGYFMGYTICKSYYRHAQNKQQAVSDIIDLDYTNLEAVKKFLNDAQYYKDKF
ncbi:hypothetical protein [Chitinophaga sp. Cy-1792]|uniref:hypothetical protein n=1 Tax=Chitinophaga sp. Cy-1792 TaxID=2608339 RepID=UPI00142107E9|nr:hypothetical protein [Chitinophaga sp. Cy-1792]NIG55446.1 hypothetical protein [Chitinophaga sp. Cy-1792]